jgi:hypothetical protein
MPKTALVLTTRGEVSTIDISTDSLSKLQGAVDGLIQPVDIDDSITMWVNEEGLLRNDLAINPLATALFIQIFEAKTPIIGDVVFTGGPDEEGNTLGLGENYLKSITSWARKYRQSVVVGL